MAVTVVVDGQIFPVVRLHRTQSDCGITGNFNITIGNGDMRLSQVSIINVEGNISEIGAGARWVIPSSPTFGFVTSINREVENVDIDIDRILLKGQSIRGVTVVRNNYSNPVINTGGTNLTSVVLPENWRDYNYVEVVVNSTGELIFQKIRIFLVTEIPDGLPVRFGGRTDFTGFNPTTRTLTINSTITYLALTVT